MRCGFIVFGLVLGVTVACSGRSVRNRSGDDGENGGGPAGGAVGNGGSAGTVAGKGGRASGSGGRGGSGTMPKGGTQSGTAGDAGAGGDSGAGAGGDSGAGAGGDSGAGQGGSDGEDECPRQPGNVRVPSDFPTIQAAIDAASDGDRISVAAGAYFENLDFLGKGIELVSETGPGTTVIDGRRLGPVIRMDSAEPVETLVEGFTLTHGSEAFGAGILVWFSARPTIRGNWFIDNQQSAGGFGAAIGGNGASPVIDANLFTRNSCDDQGLSGVLAFVNDSSPRITNNIVVSNDCRGINITASAGARPLVLNNTLVGNRVGIHVDTRVSAATQTYRNNIVVGGNVGLELSYGGAAEAPVFTNNIVFGSATPFEGVGNPLGGSDNLTVDPLFVDRAGGDFHLRADSPAIDTGAGGEHFPSARDFETRERAVDGNGSGSATVDRGAHEYGAPRACLP